MLHRTVGDSLVVITQPAHAWISGQIANVWGNPSLGLDLPQRELVLAAQQHDIAWLDWEAEPQLNPATGLPYTFSQLPTRDHLAIWNRSTKRAMSYGLVPALLISMHGTYLYERFHDYDRDTEAEAAAARAFLEQERAFQKRTLEMLEASGRLSFEHAELQRQLVSLWDAMSLAIGMGLEDSRTFDIVPTSGGPTSIQMTPIDGSLRRFNVLPWPFRQQLVELGCEGRVLEGTFGDDASLRAALHAAPTVQLEFELRPG